MGGKQKAIVFGGSVAGLLAARALSEAYSSVILVEKDSYPPEPNFRPGVPQAHHLHLFLMKGQQVLEGLFPGILDEFKEAGAPRMDAGEAFRFLTPFGWIPRQKMGLNLLPASRGLIDHIIVKRLRQIRNVEIAEKTNVIGLLSSGKQITGIRTRTPQGEASLEADLVVDASGRRTQTPKWLSELGFSAPQESVVNSFMGYASRFYKKPKGFNKWDGMMAAAIPPKDKRAGAVFPIEGDRWLVTVGGGGRDYPPSDEAGFIKFCESLRAPEFAEALKQAEPISDVSIYRAMENRYRHYEKLSDFPKELIAIGDANCSFNPVYGQGMTIAAMGAELLRTLSKRPDFDSCLFHRKLATINKVAWMFATGEDARYDETEGVKPGFFMRLMHQYTYKLQKVSVSDSKVAVDFFSIYHMVKPPAVIFKPTIVGKAFVDSFRSAHPGQ